ncbi:MAG: TRIC cation channel family protein [Candidatus Dormibacteraceae bacterium]
MPTLLLIALDAGALSLFAAAGTVKALSRGINPFIATLLGTITAVGGGAMRYVMRWGRSPLSSASTCTRAQRGLVQASSSWRAGSGFPCQLRPCSGSVSLGLRMISYWQHCNLPRAL